MHWILDAVIVLLIAGYALRGWGSGLLAGGLGLVGTLGGALLGLWAGPQVLAALDLDWPLLYRSLALLGCALVGMVLGDALIGSVGRRLRGPGAPHPLDAALGAVGATVASALVIGVAGAAVKPITPPSWARTIDDSIALRTIGAVMPDDLARQASRLTDVLDAAGFPRVFSGLFPEPELPASEPDDTTGQSEGVRAAEDSVMKIAASLTQCRGPLSANAGSGWVSAPERVVTNAHVVAGSEGVTVQAGGTGRRLAGTVVAFDPGLDLAVLHVPGLDADPLERAGRLEREDAIAVAGFPGGGPYTVSSGRVRGVVNAPGDDIYGESGVTRQVYALRAAVEQGNSGGPVLTEDGRVAGTVFARSLNDPDTAYALTNAQAGEVIDRASGATDSVGTGGCTR